MIALCSPTLASEESERSAATPWNRGCSHNVLKGEKEMLKQLMVLALAAGALGDAKCQSTVLNGEAEYMGALLKPGESIYLSPQGRVTSAVLKSDYQRGEFLFAASSQIQFYSGGAVAVGVLKDEVQLGQLTARPGRIAFHPNGKVSEALVKAGAADFNLRLPVDGSIRLTSDGRIAQFTPTSIAPYKVLDRWLTKGVTFFFDATTREYAILNGVAGYPAFIGRTVQKLTDEGLPAAVTPVIMPANTSFKFLADADPPSSFYAVWYPASFSLGNINFGPTPQVWVRDSTVTMVEVSLELAIGGVVYRPGSRVALDASGSPIAP